MYVERDLSQCYFVRQSSTGLGSALCFRGLTPATNRLRYGTAPLTCCLYLLEESPPHSSIHSLANQASVRSKSFSLKSSYSQPHVSFHIHKAFQDNAPVLRPSQLNLIYFLASAIFFVFHSFVNISGSEICGLLVY
jgi:hypothetical protein